MNGSSSIAQVGIKDTSLLMGRCLSPIKYANCQDQFSSAVEIISLFFANDNLGGYFTYLCI